MTLSSKFNELKEWKQIDLHSATKQLSGLTLMHQQRGASHRNYKQFPISLSGLVHPHNKVKSVFRQKNKYIYYHDVYTKQKWCQCCAYALLSAWNPE